MNTEHSHPVESVRYCVDDDNGTVEWLTLPEIIETYVEQRPAGLDKLRLLAPGESYYDRDVKRIFARPTRVRVTVTFEVDCVDDRELYEPVAAALLSMRGRLQAPSPMRIANIEIVEVKS